MDDVEFNFDDPNMLEFAPGADDREDEIKIVTASAKKKLAIKRAGNNVQVQRSRNVSFQQPQAQAIKQPQAPPRQFTDTSFESFSNPTKRMPPKEDNESLCDLDEISERSEDFRQEEDEGFGEESGGFGDKGFDEERPSEGFASIDDERQDLLYKFHRLESKGIKTGKRFNVQSDIREMRAEFRKIKRDSEVNSSVKFSRKMMMAVVSATEFLNNRYDPFAFELNGWSETVMGNVNDGDYDGTFEKLHDKYAGRVNTPPELELMLGLAGSAIMFHMTSSMFKSIPNMQDMAKQNPDLQNAMKSMAESLMKSQNQPQQSAPDVRQNREGEYSQGGRREMKGPSVNLGGMGGMLGGFGEMLPPPMSSSAMIPPDSPRAMNGGGRAQSPGVPESVLSDSASEMSGMSVKQVSVAVSEGGTRRGRKSKNPATIHNTIDI